MKKLLLSLLIIAATVATSSAQMQKGLGFGARAGVNISDYTGSKGDFRTGLVAGVYTDMYLSTRWALELGAYYSSQGSKNVIRQGTTAGRATMMLDNAQLQFGVKYHFVAGFRVFAAAQGAYLFKATQKSTDENGAQVKSNLANINRWDAAIVGGVGYTFKFGLDLQASYSRGFIPIFTDQKNFNSIYRVTVGWRFIGTGGRKL